MRTALKLVGLSARELICDALLTNDLQMKALHSRRGASSHFSASVRWFIALAIGRKHWWFHAHRKIEKGDAVNAHALFNVRYFT
jgi:hypothetical protein